MGYYTGTTASMSELRTALINAATTLIGADPDAGWTWDSGAEELYKSIDGVDCVVKLTVPSVDNIGVLGRSARGSGSALATTLCGRISTHADLALAWPMVYHIFVHPYEVYMVAKYSSEYFINLCFGRSKHPGLVGTGNFAASNWYATKAATATPINMLDYSQGIGSAYHNIPFYGMGTVNNALRNGYIHHNLDGAGWGEAYASAGAIDFSGGRLVTQPNTWNSEAVLIPIIVCAGRASNKQSPVLQLEHAMMTKINNYDLEEVLTIGADEWVVFPAFKKNINFPGGGQAVNHTGCIGWAIRK